MEKGVKKRNCKWQIAKGKMGGEKGKGQEGKNLMPS
jgi:hypothetical protein